MKLRLEGLQLLCWQTKTERSRRGSRVAIGNVSLSGSSWLQVGLDLLHQLAPSDYWRGDYVMCAFGTKEINFLAPQTYQGFLYTLRELSNNIINESNWEDGFKSEMGELSKKFTAHSPRCTVVSALGHRNVKHTTIQLQGRWKSPGMVQKYQRDRTFAHHCCRCRVGQGPQKRMAGGGFCNAIKLQHPYCGSPSREVGVQSCTTGDVHSSWV